MGDALSFFIVNLLLSPPARACVRVCLAPVSSGESVSVRMPTCLDFVFSRNAAEGGLDGALSPDVFQRSPRAECVTKHGHKERQRNTTRHHQRMCQKR